ncbi:hypothetical protein ACIQK9_29800 [Streptomyces hydrogenans]|uniref:hypothetical protein n=1 Tax=Streptomyces hydrogenans TaxID=1873719 RepID=UPI0037F5FD66
MQRLGRGLAAGDRRSKPVAVTEFGSAGYRGAGDRGALGLEVVAYDASGPVRLTGAYERDEEGRAAYVRELLAVFDASGVDATFVFTFALHDHVHRPDGDPTADLDLASYGVVKVRPDGDPTADLSLASYGVVKVYEDREGLRYPGLPWEPKAAFDAVAEYHRAHRAPGGAPSPRHASNRARTASQSASIGAAAARPVATSL